MHINLMIAVFIVAISASIILKNINVISYINILGTVILLILSFLIGLDVANSGHVFYFGSAVYIDSLSQIQLIIITTVSVMTALY